MSTDAPIVPAAVDASLVPATNPPAVGPAAVVVVAPETDPSVAVAIIGEGSVAFTQCLDALTEIFKGHSVGASTWVTILLAVMEQVEGIANLTGAQKKALAIALFTALLAKLPISPDHVALMSTIANFALPAIIDGIVEVAKGKWLVDQAVLAVQAACCGPDAKCVVL